MIHLRFKSANFCLLRAFITACPHLWHGAQPSSERGAEDSTATPSPSMQASLRHTQGRGTEKRSAEYPQARLSGVTASFQPLLPSTQDARLPSSTRTFIHHSQLGGNLRLPLKDPPLLWGSVCCLSLHLRADKQNWRVGQEREQNRNSIAFFFFACCEIMAIN